MSRRKPDELRVLEGVPGHRPLRGHPSTAPLLEGPPRYLDAAGRQLWKRVTGAFEATSVLQVADHAALTALCLEWSRYLVAVADLRKRGHLIPSARDGDLVKNPSATIAAQALAAWTKLASRFGLTPADRAALELPGDAPGEPTILDQILAANDRTRPPAVAALAARRKRRAT